ncbi:30S ribosomal protein S8 [Wolbachia endosymbiont of Howardula sp.]|uniref:30S ribosomal protein S8 n=1 Tax=Wolbachia endosymbiont of Howardula sp. TaxID=2916816 RepID=UPI00217F1163|nr:30S ribosomal protein S8 [Wolbachia endosymbiont of Howardula sp.]UWI83157.1 30S ribosomal protein S8 [Wolbachia endosymbiont of Howardula sp.]
MSLSDSIGDCITRIRNAQLALHKNTPVSYSRMNEAILKILKNEGFITNYDKIVSHKVPAFIITLKYYNREPVISNISRISKPGCRRYSQYKDMSKACNGLGIFIISTSQGVMTDHNAHKLKIGGEVLCHVF